MLVEVKKTKDGYLIPKEALKNVDKDKLLIEIEIKDKNKMAYKDLVGEAVWEHYLEKREREVPSKLSKEKLEEYSKKLGLENIHSFKDVLNNL